jgi:hypothetical protein
MRRAPSCFGEKSGGAAAYRVRLTATCRWFDSSSIRVHQHTANVKGTQNAAVIRKRARAGRYLARLTRNARELFEA